MSDGLFKYILRTNEILQNIDYGVDFTKLPEIKSYITELNIMIADIEHVLYKMQDAHNKVCIINNNIVNNYQNIQKNYDDNLKLKQYVSNENVIENIDDLPKTRIYWVNSIKQYAINVDGIVLRGNIGNIYNKNSNNIHNYIMCKQQNRCKKILNGIYCDYYHDPIDLLELKNEHIISNSFYESHIQKTRNFMNTSWLYTEHLRSNNMRHIGSKKLLSSDLAMMQIKKNSLDIQIEIKDFNAQIIHDILVMREIKLAGLLQ